MKIIFAKYNSCRNKEYRLSTCIFKDGDKKYVVKTALNPMAETHIDQICNGYKLIVDNYNLKGLLMPELLKMDNKTIRSSYLDGQTYESLLVECLNKGDIDKFKELLLNYKKWLYSAFTTEPGHSFCLSKADFIKQDVSFEIEDKYYNFAPLDLIFSNIIVNQEGLNLIDQEWTYPFKTPVSYVLYRSLLYLYTNNERAFSGKIESKDLFSFIGLDASVVETFGRLEADFQELVRGSYFEDVNKYRKSGFKLEQLLREMESCRNSLNVVANKCDFLEQHYNNHVATTNLLYFRITNKVVIALYKIKHLPGVLKVVKKIMKKILMPFNGGWVIVFCALRNPIVFLKIFKKKTENYKSYKLVNMKTDILNEQAKHSFNRKYIRLSRSEIIKQRADVLTLKRRPLISIVVPVYNTPVALLKKCIKSVLAQTYSDWELCLVNDGSSSKATLDYLKNIKHPKIKIKNQENKGIAVASNEAVKMSKGDYIALLDHDDIITKGALYELVKAISTYAPDFIYTDEFLMNKNGFITAYHFKPDYSEERLLAQNYVCHFVCLSRALFERIKGFRSGFEGSQDHDLVLRACEEAKKIHHISKPLYGWRISGKSFSTSVETKNTPWDSGVKVIQDAVVRRSISVDDVSKGVGYGTYRVKRKINPEDKVSIIIPFKDQPDITKRCLDSILTKSTYRNFEVICVNNNSTQDETLKMVEYYKAKDNRIKFLDYNLPFNYSAINNYAVDRASGEHLLLLNNDTEVISDDWIESLLEYSQIKDVGAVGAMLYYPNNLVQHAGVVVGLGGVAAHAFSRFGRGSSGYFGRLKIPQEVSAVTAACMMVKKTIFIEVGGLDVSCFSIAFNDIDFCLNVLSKGYKNIWTPYCELYHYESLSRGYENTPYKLLRFGQECWNFRQRHGKILSNGDPYYNRHLTLSDTNFSYSNDVNLIG